MWIVEYSKGYIVKKYLLPFDFCLRPKNMGIQEVVNYVVAMSGMLRLSKEKNRRAVCSPPGLQ